MYTCIQAAYSMYTHVYMYTYKYMCMCMCLHAHQCTDPTEKDIQNSNTLHHNKNRQNDYQWQQLNHQFRAKQKQLSVYKSGHHGNKQKRSFTIVIKA